MTSLRIEPLRTQLARWPASGRHILAQFDTDAVVVYQAYRPAIGHFAAQHGHFGGEFSLSRMSWIKPNFLWMMYRCGWATKEGQEVVLAIWLERTAFDAILAAGVPSTYDRVRYADRDDWQTAVQRSSVRLQWDPDHGPGGEPLERRAIQLGLRGDVLASFASEPHPEHVPAGRSRRWIRKLEDITPFVREQHAVHLRGGDVVTPEEHVYPCAPTTAIALGIAS